MLGAGHMEGTPPLLVEYWGVMLGKEQSHEAKGFWDSHAYVHWAPLPYGSPTPLLHFAPRNLSIQAQSQVAAECT